MPEMTRTPVTLATRAAIKRSLKEYKLSPDQFARALAHGLKLARKPQAIGCPPVPERVAEIPFDALSLGYLYARE